MLQNSARQPLGELTRAQLAMLNTLSDEISLSPDDRRRALDLNEFVWKAWINFLTDGPLPQEPPLPEMLRRIGQTAFNLAVVADQHVAVG